MVPSGKVSGAARDAPHRLGLIEYTALMAMLSAMVAFSIDSMLPAMGLIADELSPADPNRAQWVISSFLVGLGLGTLVAGPLTDAIGRRATILLGIALYACGALLAWFAPSLEAVLAARILQGLGASGPRVAVLAVTRDLFTGREMARVISIMMTIFALVPAAAPLIGSFIMAWSGWRGIFLAFVCFGAVAATWYALRQPETLDRRHRRPFRAAVVWDGVQVVLSNRHVMLTILALMLSFSMLFLVIATTHQVFVDYFGQKESFPWWFALVSLLAASGGLINARVVVLVGMRRVVGIAFGAQAAASALFTCFALSGPGLDTLFPIYIAWLWSVFMTTAFTIGNLNALAMEPLGHVAGVASSVVSAFATIGGVAFAIPAGMLLDGTPLIQTLNIALCAGFGLLVVRMIADQDTAPLLVRARNKG